MDSESNTWCYVPPYVLIWIQFRDSAPRAPVAAEPRLGVSLFLDKSKVGPLAFCAAFKLLPPGWALGICVFQRVLWMAGLEEDGSSVVTWGCKQYCAALTILCRIHCLVISKASGLGRRARRDERRRRRPQTAPCTRNSMEHACCLLPPAPCGVDAAPKLLSSSAPQLPPPLPAPLC
jgi:hypothetical protein